MRVIIRTLSELCITVGSVIVLFVAYVLLWTGVKADSAMDDQIASLQDRWSKGTVAAESEEPGAPTPENPEPPAPYQDGDSFAVMYIPRLGFTWNKPVLEGTKTDTLKKGLGH